MWRGGSRKNRAGRKRQRMTGMRAEGGPGVIGRAERRCHGSLLRCELSRYVVDTRTFLRTIMRGSLTGDGLDSRSRWTSS